jgi:16S rRNA (cytidine1402-2'-O)-methyltransferase
MCGEKAIVPIPGPSALSAALSVAGLQMDEFIFLGFLPHKKGRQTLLNEIATLERSAVLYESPHRIQKLFLELTKRIPNRHAVIFREMTKIYEQIASGTVLELSQRLTSEDIPSRGEFVVVLGSSH